MTRLNISQLAQNAQPYRLGLEDDNVVGRKDQENEYVYYARVDNPEQVKQLGTSVTQDQWQIKIPRTDKNRSGGSIRVRRIIEDGQERFVRTIKLSGPQGTDGLQKAQELTMPSNLAEFECFRDLAESGMHKDRVTIPTGQPGLTWEVDLFIMADGSYAPWCKIDLEVGSEMTSLPEIPPVFHEVIRETGPAMDQETRKVVTSLYDQYFTQRSHSLT